MISSTRSTRRAFLGGTCALFALRTLRGQQLGLDYKKMEIPVFGRNFHLVEEGSGPIQPIFA